MEQARFELRKRNAELIGKYGRLDHSFKNGLLQKGSDIIASAAVRRSAGYVLSNMEGLATRDLSRLQRVDPELMFSLAKTVFLVGIHGSGKSTLLCWLVNELHEGRLWKDKYDFIFFLDFTEVIALLGTETFTIENVLSTSYPGVFRHVTFNDVVKSKYLIIVDSYEESYFRKMYSSTVVTVFQLLIRNMIASQDDFDRIIACSPISCDLIQLNLVGYVPKRVVELLGFSRLQVLSCVLKICRSDKAGFVWKKIRKNETLLTTACLPLFTDIICQVLSCNSSALMETSTELYVWAYVVIQTRHLNQNRPFVDTSPYEKLFSYKLLTKALVKVAEMAFENLTTGKILFEADAFFSATALNSTLISPFLVYREGGLCLSNSAHILRDFLAAVYVFLWDAKVWDKVLEVKYSNRVMLFLFGLLGASTKSTDAPEIVQAFVQPLLIQCEVEVLDTHVLSGQSGESLYHLVYDTSTYMDLCFEFNNSHMLSDGEVLWKNDATLTVYQHSALKRVLFFIKHLRGREQKISRLDMHLADHQMSVHESSELYHCIESVGTKVEVLGFRDFVLKEEMMAFLSLVFCLTPTVELRHIRTTNENCYKIFLQSVRNTHQNSALRLEKLLLHDVKVNEEIMEYLAPLVCMIPTVELRNINAKTKTCWSIFRKHVLVAHCNKTIRLRKLDLDFCYNDREIIEEVCKLVNER